LLVARAVAQRILPQVEQPQAVALVDIELQP
jgi:hypothetical protein